ncbi:hypothetical protein C8Q78DRAFT_1069099 [Trametes maxima]|nr:hypothetical protein C8Q78DRAFT_1069099 [Trametes maxima]
MFAGYFFLLSVLTGSAFAAFIPYRSVASATFDRRTQDFNAQDLINSCPGGPGSDKFEKADRCTLVNVVQNPDVRKWAVLGDPQLNCGNATGSISEMLGGSHTVTQTTTVDASFGIELEGVTLGGGVSSSDEDSTTLSRSITFDVPPGRQAVYVAGTLFKSVSGNVQVNYPDRQEGHFEWTTGAKVTQLTPVPDDVEFDVHETDCGTDPRDLSGYNS